MWTFLTIKIIASTRPDYAPDVGKRLRCHFSFLLLNCFWLNEMFVPRCESYFRAHFLSMLERWWLFAAKLGRRHRFRFRHTPAFSVRHPLQMRELLLAVFFRKMSNADWSFQGLLTIYVLLTGDDKVGILHFVFETCLWQSQCRLRTHSCKWERNPFLRLHPGLGRGGRHGQRFLSIIRVVEKLPRRTSSPFLSCSFRP